MEDESERHFSRRLEQDDGTRSEQIEERNDGDLVASGNGLIATSWYERFDSERSDLLARARTNEQI